MFRVRSHREESLTIIYGGGTILFALTAFIGVAGLEGSMPFYRGATLVLVGTIVGWKFFHRWLNSY